MVQVNNCSVEKLKTQKQVVYYFLNKENCTELIWINLTHGKLEVNWSWPGRAGFLSPLLQRLTISVILSLIYVYDIVDLETDLHRWDQNGNGVIDKGEIEALGDYMPDPPSPEEVEQFDFDHNGSIDLNELKIALGYKPYPSG